MTRTGRATAKQRESGSWTEWNRRFHIYLGLYFVVSIWLFAVSGLLLNHSWQFTEFWSQRRQSASEYSIVPPPATDDLGRARNLMRQLKLAGEIEWKAGPEAEGIFAFRVVRPGLTADVSADLVRHTATVEEIRVNGWGILRMLHSFSGVRRGAPGTGRDWWLTWLWSGSMDALSVGLLILVFGSLVMAWNRHEKRRGAGIVLVLGLLASGFFVFALRVL